MKVSRLVVSLLMTLFLFQVHSYAQIDDSLPPWFKSPIDIAGFKTFKGADAFDILNRRQVQAVSASVTQKMASQKIMLPKRLRQLKNPMILKRGGKCYEIKCFNAGNCKDCGMFWMDRNGDNKVQPRREVRCGCPGNPKAKCNMDWREVDCK